MKRREKDSKKGQKFMLKFVTGYFYITQFRYILYGWYGFFYIKFPFSPISSKVLSATWHNFI